MNVLEYEPRNNCGSLIKTAVSKSIAKTYIYIYIYRFNTFTIFKWCSMDKCIPRIKASKIHCMPLSSTYVSRYCQIEENVWIWWLCNVYIYTLYTCIIHPHRHKVHQMSFHEFPAGHFSTSRSYPCPHRSCFRAKVFKFADFRKHFFFPAKFLLAYFGSEAWRVATAPPAKRGIL